MEGAYPELGVIADELLDGGNDRNIRLGRVSQTRGAGEVRVVLRAVRAIEGPESDEREDNAG